MTARALAVSTRPPAADASPELRHRLLVGVRGHGGEEVYSTLLARTEPPGFASSVTLDFHRSCGGARSRGGAEVLLNRLVRPWLRFDLGFRVLRVDPSVDLVHVHSHPTILRGLGRRPVVCSAGSSHLHYVRDYERWSAEKIAVRYARARRLYRRLGVVDPLLNHEQVTLAYTFSRHARRTYLEHGVPPWKIRVLYPGFDVPEPAPRPRRPGVTFLFMGRQPARKGGPDVLAAFARVRTTLPDARLLYLTDEPPARAIDGVEAGPLVPAAEVPSVFARADVFLSPSRAEGFGMVNVEAHGHGLPVISSRLGAIPEVVEDGGTGLLAPPGDVDALAAAMRRLGADPELRLRMGRAARARFVERFTLAGFRAGLAALYEEALARAGDGER